MENLNFKTNFKRDIVKELGHLMIKKSYHHIIDKNKNLVKYLKKISVSERKTTQDTVDYLLLITFDKKYVLSDKPKNRNYFLEKIRTTIISIYTLLTNTNMVQDDKFRLHFSDSTSLTMDLRLNAFEDE